MNAFKKAAALGALLVAGLAAAQTGSGPAISASPKPSPLSAATQAKIAKWNALNPDAPASKEMGIVLQEVEDAATSLIEASEAIDVDAALSREPGGTALKDQLSSFRNCAKRLLAAVIDQKDQMRIELRRTRSSLEEQRQVVTKTAEGYRLMEAWVASAIRAADAGLTMCDLLSRNLPADGARQQFTDTWKALSEAEQKVRKRAGRFSR